MRVFGLPGYSDVSPQLSILDKYLWLSFSTKQPVNSGSASAYKIKVVRIDKEDGIVAASSMIAALSGVVNVQTQLISARGLFLLATLPSGKVYSTTDPLTLFKLDSSLLNDNNKALALLLLDPLSFRLIEV